MAGADTNLYCFAGWQTGNGEMPMWLLIVILEVGGLGFKGRILSEVLQNHQNWYIEYFVV